MSFKQQPDFAEQVADLNKYGQALNNCESVEEVVSLSLEAMSLLFEFPATTFLEVREGELRIVHSTHPETAPGEEPSEVARRAFERRDTIVSSGGRESVGTTVAVPATIVDDVVAVIESSTLEEHDIGDEVIRPLEILAAHTATAISNIRSRERLERARRDLEKRKEMIELYDRLLRHDLGNDLQVIAGFAEVIDRQVDGEVGDYAERIERTARGSADLIERVGDLVNTLEQQDEPEPQRLDRVLTEVVETVTGQYESLSVEFDPAAFEYTVYGGDLLDSVFTNIVSNAAVHNDGDVHVRITPVAEPDTVTVCIADDGAGIPGEVADSLFEMGAKGPDSEGSGFGLGFVKALTESYGGRIAVQESDSGGADFRVTLERA